MSRKDFTAFALLFATEMLATREDTDVVLVQARRATIRALAVRVAGLFARTNDRFDREKFLAACEGKGM